MKRSLLILATIFYSTFAFAEHITGGEMFYTLTGTANGEFQYHITLKLYRDCFSQGAQLDASAPIAIFNKSTNAMVWNNTVSQTKVETLNLNTPGPCISNAPRVCYQVGYYEFDISLPGAPFGYTVAYQRCCRINGISNLVSSGSIGATYTADIPGTSILPTAPQNSSAKFSGIDTVIVCGGYPFTYSFAATDADGDQLRYSFCEAYVGGGQGQSSGGGPNTASPNPPAAPPYQGVPYTFPFGSGAPLGVDVTINSNTGLITGKSPAEGIYVVTVCVDEIRSGTVIATQRKDLQIKAGGCDIAKALLDPQYISCDGFTMDFSNRSSSPLINSYYWEFGDPASGVNNTSTSATPTHTFSVAGNYTIKLVTNRNQECSDSTTSIVRVWPGFNPDFSTSGICVKKPVLFTDHTTTAYGVVDSWSWNFGDENSSEDTSHLQNPGWSYSSIGVKTISFTVTNSKGCIKTITKDVSVIDKPPITLAFRDTLICIPDAVQLQASGQGNFSWGPNINIINTNSPTPTVNPTTTTVYHVTLDEQGCVNTDSVQIRVVDHVTLTTLNDPTTICLTDPVQLNILSDGLRFLWTPAGTLNDATLQNPVATPTGTTNYQVTASIGSCSAVGNINIITVPYPVANAGVDTTICFNTPAFLHGSHDGSSFSWSPTGSLMNAGTLTPIAYPARTTEYVLTSFDTRGCPKPGRDTVLVSLLPKIQPYAGNDTMVVVGQPLQLNAEGGVRYNWTPPTGLNDPTIKSPIGHYETEIDSIRYTVEVFNILGCSDSATIKVIVFKTNPYVFVPTAFTPNGDGLNDVVRPIAVGVERITYFRVFNRWGQMVFSTTTNGAGWDGKISGVLQGSNVFVWMVGAIDYTGKPIFLKGTTTLIR
jgi:gliding motility-associated-like protein